MVFTTNIALWFVVSKLSGLLVKLIQKIICTIMYNCTHFNITIRISYH